LIIAGYGLSAFAIAPLQTWFINPMNYHVNDEGYFTQKDLLQRVPEMFLLLAGLFGTLQVVALLFLGEPKNYQLAEVTQRALFAPDSNLTLDDDDEEDQLLLDENDFGGEETPLHPATSHFNSPSHYEIFTSDTFVLLFLTLFLNGVWVQTSGGLFKTYGQMFIKDDFFLATVNSLGAATNCLSRVLWGLVVDKTSYQMSMVVATALGAFLMWTLGVIRLIGDRYLFMLWICAMFACIGATYTLLPYATHRSFGGKNFGISYGFLQLSLSLAGLVTALSMQFILPLVGFQVMFIAVGGAMLISLLITCLIHLTKYGRGTCT